MMSLLYSATKRAEEGDRLVNVVREVWAGTRVLVVARDAEQGRAIISNLGGEQGQDGGLVVTWPNHCPLVGLRADVVVVTSRVSEQHASWWQTEVLSRLEVNTRVIEVRTC